METDVRMLRSSSTRAIVGIDPSCHVSLCHFTTKRARGGGTVTTIAANDGRPLEQRGFFVGLVGRARLACRPYRVSSQNDIAKNMAFDQQLERVRWGKRKRAVREAATRQGFEATRIIQSHSDAAFALNPLQPDEPLPGGGHRGPFLSKRKSLNREKSKTQTLSFCLRGEIDKTILHKTKPRKKFAEDGRMDAFGSGERKGQVNSAPIPVHSLSSLT
jgi:hypothetical protein